MDAPPSARAREPHGSPNRGGRSPEGAVYTLKDGNVKSVKHSETIDYDRLWGLFFGYHMFRHSHFLAILCSNLPRTVVIVMIMTMGREQFISSWAWVEFYQHSFFPQLIGGFNMSQLWSICFIPTLWQPRIFTFDLCSIHFHTKDFKIFQLWSSVIYGSWFWIETCWNHQLMDSNMFLCWTGRCFGLKPRCSREEACPLCQGVGWSVRCLM